MQEEQAIQVRCPVLHSVVQAATTGGTCRSPPASVHARPEVAHAWVKQYVREDDVPTLLFRLSRHLHPV